MGQLFQKVFLLYESDRFKEDAGKNAMRSEIYLSGYDLA